MLVMDVAECSAPLLPSPPVQGRGPEMCLQAAPPCPSHGRLLGFLGDR
jgi:hypothetical protein